MKLSDEGIRFIKIIEEGSLDPKLHAYRDAVGVWTIGWGCTKGVYAGMTITREQAEAMFEGELAGFVSAVNSLVKVSLSQHQFDALVSFSYNVGIGALEKSTLLKKLNTGNYVAVPAELMRWTHAGGRELGGLVKRRKAEGDMWKSSDAKPEPINEPMAQKVDAPKEGVAPMLQIISAILGGLIPAQGSTPAQTSGAGVTITPTTTATNLLGLVVSAVVGALGASNFGADAMHTVGAIGGALTAILALVNHFHVVSASNANTINTIASLLTQVGQLQAAAQVAPQAPAVPSSPVPVAHS